MTAITPNAPNHDNLEPLSSRFVDVEALPWEPTEFPGVEAKTLLVDEATGLLTALMRMAPGARLPDHEHVRIEQTLILEGHLVDADGEVTAGNYGWRPAAPARGLVPTGRPDAGGVCQTQSVLPRGRCDHRHAGTRLR
jgi:hypothetical protein